MPGRPNFYVLLDLDPAVDDPAAIAARITDKQRQWAVERTQGNPKAQRQAQRNLELLPEIERTLKNPEDRRKEGQEARRHRQDALRAEIERLDEAIEVLRSQGTRCDEAQVGKLVQAFAGILTEEEVRKRLTAAGVQVGAGPEAGPRRPRAAREGIDPVVASGIRRNLEILGLASLYDFLGLRPQSSPAALQDAAAELYRQSQSRGRTDAETSARNELAGFAKTVFRDEAEKEKYDNTLAVEALEGLKHALEQAGHDGFIGREELDTLVRQAVKRGVKADRAREYIEDYAAKRKWRIQGEAAAPAERLRVCGFCGTLAAGGAAQRCTGCGEPLDLDCPRCGARNPSDAAACGKCGCQVGDAPLVKSLLERGRHHVLEGELAEAIQCFGKALHYWPDWQPAAVARREAEERAERREAEIRALEELLRRNELLAARQALDRLERQSGAAGLAARRRQIDDGVARAQEAFRRGEERRRAGDGEGALGHYEDALAVCADFEPAKQALAASPPPAPESLAVHATAAGFRLTWTCRPARGAVGFRVVRKAQGAPRDETDGEIAAEIRDLVLDDTAAPAGEPVHYAVFAVRGGAVSPAAARSGPHLRLAEVADLAAAAGDGEVALSWRPPPGCRRVEVRRQGGDAPARAGEGQAVAVTGAGAHDTDLTNGTRYGYRVAAVYADPLQPGREVYTPGVEIAATPVAPPAPVSDLRAARTGRTVTLSWTPVPGAAVQIRQAARLPEYAPGLILPVVQAERFGAPVPASGPGGAQVQLDGQGQFFFVPLTVRAGTVVAGAAASVVTLDPVSRLQARRAGSGIALTWDWPAGGEEALVAYAHDRPPHDPHDGRATRVRVTRREYDRIGCWELRVAEHRRHYFTVFACAGDTDLYAPGVSAVEAMGQETEVRYRVVRPRGWLRGGARRAHLELRCNDPSRPALPALVVVGKPQGVPVSPRDGRVLEELPGARLEAGRAAIELPDPGRGAGLYVKLFFKEADAAREVRLLPAAREELWLA